MNSDPLGLNEVSTPEIIRHDRAAPLPEVCRLHRRMITNDCADSLETKIVVLTHMIYLAYTDLKDNTTR
jgi:hypothetical protein